MEMVVTSMSLVGVMVSTLARNVRNVGSIRALGEIFPIFITATTLVAVTICCLVAEPTLCKCIACMYIIVSIKWSI